MASQIIATWTAFEALAKDLWEAALNAKPAILAKLVGRGQSKPKAGDDPKRIRLDWLYRHDFDLSSHMGTIFIEENRYGFDSMDGLRDAYRDAFSLHGETVVKIVSNEMLDACNSIRNVLVHNGGIVDARYLKRSAHLPPQAVGELGKPIQIDGELVARINGPVIKAGHDLIIAVDNWLAAH